MGKEIKEHKELKEKLDQIIKLLQEIADKVGTYV